MTLCHSFPEVATLRNQREAFRTRVHTNTYTPSIHGKDRWILPESLPTQATVLLHVLEALPVSNFRALSEMNRKKQTTCAGVSTATRKCSPRYIACQRVETKADSLSPPSCREELIKTREKRKLGEVEKYCYAEGHRVRWLFSLSVCLSNSFISSL